MSHEVSRREFLARLGVTVGTAAAGAAAAAGVPLAAVPLVGTAHAQQFFRIGDHELEIVHESLPRSSAADIVGHHRLLVPGKAG